MTSAKAKAFILRNMISPPPTHLPSSPAKCGQTASDKESFDGHCKNWTIESLDRDDV